MLSTYRVRVEADRAEAPVLLANGNLENFGEADDPARHWAVWADPHKKPCYLFALVGGDLAHISDSLRHRVRPQGRAAHLCRAGQGGARALRHGRAQARDGAGTSASSGANTISTFSMIVAVSDFNMGAMENKGLNVFNDKYVLASPADRDRRRLRGYRGRDRARIFSQLDRQPRHLPRLVPALPEGGPHGLPRPGIFRRHALARRSSASPTCACCARAQFPEDAGPLAHNVRPEVYNEINNFYTATVYQKGAEVVRMLKRLIGPRTFRAGMDLYFQRHDGTAATVEEFIACFAEVSGRDLRPLHALVHCRLARPSSRSGGSLRPGRADLSSRDRPVACPDPGPGDQAADDDAACVRSCRSAGRRHASALARRVRRGELEERGARTQGRAERTIVFRDVPRRPALSFLRGFSAPVRVEDDLTEDDLVVLSRHDSDNFNRWQALQSLATRVLLRGVKAIRAGRPPERNAGLVAAFGALIEDARLGRLDPAFATLAMTLPSEADIAREIGEDVDPDAIYAARKTLRGALGRAHGDALIELHRQLANSSPFSPDAAAAGRRALRNGALALFVDGNVIDGLALAHLQLREADNMTERLGALSVIALKPSSTREHTLDAFGRRYAMEPLILDKWFALQAQIPERETLERVEGLMSHRGFSMSNPNRVRALIGGFSANHTQFNRADGAGFALLEKVVVTLDPTNPQIAARLLTAMRSWRSLEDERRRQAEAMLRRIAAQPTLSPDVRDIVTRSLG